MPIADLRYNIFSQASDAQHEWRCAALHIALRLDVKPELTHIIEASEDDVSPLIAVWERIAAGGLLQGSEIVVMDSHYYEMFTHALNAADVMRRMVEDIDYGPRTFPYSQFSPMTQNQMLDAIFLETSKYRFQKSIDVSRENLFAAVYTPAGAEKLLKYHEKKRTGRLHGKWCFLPMVRQFDREAVEAKCGTLF